MGSQAGVYRSPIQFRDQARIGWLALVPQEANYTALEKELMRKFRFEIPIALKLDWVSMPYVDKTKWSEKEPGIRLWHVFVPLKHACHCDCILRQWLHPDMPKKDFPYAAIMTYASDHQATQKGILSIAPGGGWLKPAFLAWWKEHEMHRI